MSGFRHSNPVAHRGRRPKGSNASPATPDNRVWITDMGNGFMREDVGAPPARSPNETQPISLGTLGAPEAPPPVPEATPDPMPLPVRINTAPRSANWQREFGLGK
jgi:hypothetical protein